MKLLDLKDVLRQQIHEDLVSAIRDCRKGQLVDRQRQERAVARLRENALLEGLRGSEFEEVLREAQSEVESDGLCWAA